MIYVLYNIDREYENDFSPFIFFQLIHFGGENMENLNVISIFFSGVGVLLAGVGVLLAGLGVLKWGEKTNLQK